MTFITYGYYSGIIVPEREKATKTSAPVVDVDRKKEQEERQARIKDLELEISDLQANIGRFEDIPLVGVEVTVMAKGAGIIVGQKMNRVTVRFAEEEKTYILDERYKGRPRFNNDEDVVAANTDYNRKQEKIKLLKKDLQVLKDSGYQLKGAQ